MKFYHTDPVTQETLHTWYFSPTLAWQQDPWVYFTQQFPNLPHAMLFAGNPGTGKRQFVYKLVAWMLCQQKTSMGACGHCESCQWLKSGTHPNLLQIPSPISPDHEGTAKKLTGKKSDTTANNLTDTTPHHASNSTIKIDDIRDLQPFVQHSSEGHRVVVLHHAESMTLGASNALLKTLEEPAQNVFLILLSDTPSRLLATIRSRLQQFNVSKVSQSQALDYIREHLDVSNFSQWQLSQALGIAGFAPMVAMDMLTSPWYQERQTWLNSWQAIRSGARQSTQASDYWQGQLTLSDFLYLSQLMLMELGKHISELPTLQQDINWGKLTPSPNLLTVYTLQQVIEQIWQDRRQHIGDKLCYDKLMYAFSNH